MRKPRKVKLFEPWTEKELAWLRDRCQRDPELKATEIAELFVAQFETRSLPAVETRVYKMRREGDVVARRSVLASSNLKVLVGEGGPASGKGTYVLRFPNGWTAVGDKKHILKLLTGTP